MSDLTRELYRLEESHRFEGRKRTSDAFHRAVLEIHSKDAEIERLRKVVAFFASCIKSGEPWDAYCDGALEEVGLGPQHRGGRK